MSKREREKREERILKEMNRKRVKPTAEVPNATKVSASPLALGQLASNANPTLNFGPSVPTTQSAAAVGAGASFPQTNAPAAFKTDTAENQAITNDGVKHEFSFGSSDPTATPAINPAPAPTTGGLSFGSVSTMSKPDIESVAKLPTGGVTSIGQAPQFGSVSAPTPAAHASLPTVSFGDTPAPFTSSVPIFGATFGDSQKGAPPPPAPQNGFAIPATIGAPAPVPPPAAQELGFGNQPNFSNAPILPSTSGASARRRQAKSKQGRRHP